VTALAALGLLALPGPGAAKPAAGALRVFVTFAPVKERKDVDETTKRDLKAKPDNCFVLFSIGPGGEMKPGRFARVPAAYRFRKKGVWAWKISSPASSGSGSPGARQYRLRLLEEEAVGAGGVAAVDAGAPPPNR
jgi:hypothetical protein